MLLTFKSSVKKSKHFFCLHSRYHGNGSSEYRFYVIFRQIYEKHHNFWLHTANCLKFEYVAHFQKFRESFFCLHSRCHGNSIFENRFVTLHHILRKHLIAHCELLGIWIRRSLSKVLRENIFFSLNILSAMTTVVAQIQPFIRLDAYLCL